MSESATFKSLGLSKQLLSTLSSLGYEAPSPVQAQSIPILLQDRDLIAQAQTGTGKTAAFALPILEKIDPQLKKTQALVLAPTRELAIQVAEAFQSYAKHLPHFHIAPIYGGQSYVQQLRALKRGAHIVVGTPGRLMDHMRRKTLSLDSIQTLVLDEADEMLRMGFIDDVEWILEHMPNEHQTALFSATMPTSIQKVAKNYLHEPQHVKVKSKTMTAASIVQNAMLVSSKNKIEALTRYLEYEKFDGAIIFARTKNMTTELAEKLSARGYSVSALNGDMNQNAREKVIDRVKRKSLDIIVATDVAARGLDVERLSHVINYDAPYDAETYVHRIGRTGRAGREGKSLLMLTPREQNHLRNIERTTKQKIEAIDPPTIKELNKSRIDNFTAKLTKVLKKGNLDEYRELIEKIIHDTEYSELDVASALFKLAQKDKPLEVKGEEKSLLDKSESFSKSSKTRRGNSSRGREDGRRRRRGNNEERRGSSANRNSKRKGDSAKKNGSRGNSASKNRSASKGKSRSANTGRGAGFSKSSGKKKSFKRK